MEVYRELIEDKNNNGYILILEKICEAVDGNLYILEKDRNGKFSIGSEVGFFLLEMLPNRDTAKVELYGVIDGYKNLGLGKALIEVSKKFAIKMGYKYLKLCKMRREVEYKHDPTIKTDANLILYLKSGFKLQEDGVCCFQSADMICDLYEQENATSDEKIKAMLDNEKFAFKKMAEIEQNHYKKLSSVAQSLRD